MSDTIDRLRNEKARVGEQRDALERRIEEINAAICEAEGDALGAEWHRLLALGKHDEAHAAWVRMMGAAAVRMGRDPAEWVKDDAQQTVATLRAEVEKLRGAQADTP
jgi:hypothetical protein